ncbi:MAG: hypothetical protein WCD89_00675 [Anaerocolumna sp.]
MSRSIIIRRLLALQFCIMVMSAGMYAPNMEIDSLFSYSDVSDTKSTSFVYIHKMDATDEIFGNVTGEVTANVSSGLTFSYRIIPITISFLLAILPFVPLFNGITLNVLLQDEFVDRMYLILFIHNSDGKKGDRTDILVA